MTGPTTVSRTALALAAAYAVALLVLVLGPIAWWLNRLTVHIYVWWNYGFMPGSITPEDAGFALNVLLFVPLGAGVVLLLRRSLAVAVVVAVLVSVAVELVQLTPLIGRDAQLSDVLSNGIGGAVGALPAAWWVRRAVRAR